MVRPGFSLPEVLVSTVLLSVGVLGASAACELASRMLREAALEEGAAAAAAIVLDSLLQQAAPAGGVVEIDRYRLTWSVRSGDGAADLLELEVEPLAGPLDRRWVFAARHAAPPPTLRTAP